MNAEWSIEEDAKPGRRLLRTQPEVSGRGKLWTQRIFVTWPSEGHTQLMIRECIDGTIGIDHGRIYPLRHEEEDGA